MTPLLALERAAVGYGRRPFLRGIDLAVSPGDFLAVAGPNGGGKTTILRALLGAIPLAEGRLVRPRRVRIGYVPQRDQVDAVWPFSTGEVVTMGRVAALGPLRRPGAEDREKARRAMAQVGIEALHDLPYAQLSGGQRQRALIARALAAEPELLALDEPTNGMDPVAEDATMRLLRGLHDAGGIAVVMVSHRLEAVASSARTLALVDKDRGLFQVGPLEEMLAPGPLAALFGQPVAVRHVDGHWLVVPSGGEEAR